ncbi:LamG-like jellyroll fold domain-containing protein [Plantactinospora sp. WMMB334]|uniref:LamG-like jellyroll fold domain-containing protein n=1 Tax=Plantactinospora sp. WMMB334 TaxID=3404119 RepID=UPI003B93E712
MYGGWGVRARRRFDHRRGIRRGPWQLAWRATALALCVLLGAHSAQPGTTAALSHPPYESAAGGGGHRGRDAPKQRWGSAAGQAHTVDGRRNTTVPQSLRNRYPLRAERAAPVATPNPAAVVDPPAAPAPRFDPQASRELPTERDAHHRTYRNPDGTATTEFSTDPINYRSAAGGWAPIDSTLVRSGTGWRNAADSVDLRLADRADAAELVRVGLDGGHALGYGLAGARASAATVDGATATYRNVLPQTDLELVSQAGGVKETLVLRSASAPRAFLFPLRLTGLTPRLVDGEVRLVDGAGTVRAVIPAGFMTDAAATPALSTGVDYRLVTVSGGPALEIVADDAWLRDPARVFPVRLDPSVEPAGADDSMVVQGGSSRSGASELLAGNLGGNAASYLRFDGLNSRLRYHTIYGAQLQIVNYDAPSCSPRRLSVHEVTQAWTGPGGHSYPGPSVGSALASQSFAYGHIQTGQSQSRCPARGTLFDLGNTGRRMVQGWVDGTRANNGLSLRAPAGDSSAWKRIAGSGTANRPRLYVTHSPYNASYTIPNPVPEPPVLQNQAGKVRVTVTNRGAEAWTSANYYLAYRAYNAATGAAVTQQRTANLPGTLARGATVTLDATIRALPPGRYFLDFTMVRTGGIVFTDEQVPPGRIVLEVFDIAPVVQELHPPNGYQTPTLTPQLWARAVDIDAPPGSSLRFKFEYCERTDAGTNVNCANSGFLTSQAWTVPAGRLAWTRTYVWRTVVADAGNEVTSDWSTLLTAVPQPEITSRVAAAPYGSSEREFDPQVGNFSTAALDASVTTVGPDLRVVRTYNSLDPRRDLSFGAGWVTVYDMRLVPDDDGSGNVVVTYPDGQQVRFGRNPDGTFAAPQGRAASLVLSGSTYTLADRAGMSYQFSGTGRLTRISDAAARAVVLSYDPGTGRLARAHVSNSQTNTAGRALHFTWTGGHVTSVRTDLVGGTAPTWNYTYTGDLLTRVCAPGDVCTAYQYTAGSHYRAAVLDSRPESYWRLGETQGSAAGSEIAVNLGRDAATARNLTLGAAGALPGTDNTGATFNGTTSVLELPKGTLKKNRDAAVEVWFKMSGVQTGGPLVGYQNAALGSVSSAGVPLLYVGTDGRLRGQFRTGTIAPITSTGLVNDNRWHHVVLSAMGGTQTLYLDGRVAGTLTAPIDHANQTVNQVGAAYASTPSSWPAWGATAQRHFSGTIDEVAVYAHPLGPAAVTAHHQLGTTDADQLSQVTLPSGKIAAEATYDVTLNRISEYTDRNGGTWRIGAPAVYGGDTDLRRSIQVLDPAGRPHLYEYDALAGRMLRSGSPLGIGVREEDQPGYRTPSPTPSPTPTELCNSPDPGDPRFCTVIPGSSGGPVFVGHTLDGMAIRSFSYDDRGFQNVVTNENGDAVTLGYDDRGNVISRRTCRTSTQCFTTYSTYPTVTNPLDPRNDLPTEVRDGRSAGATDPNYRTSMSYHPTGQLSTQTGPDGATVRHTYTTGGEAAVGGGATPPALVRTTTDPRGAVTRYDYHANGDLARVTEPSGLVTSFGYDALGRRISETEVSDTFPEGVTTSFSYDALSRLRTVTGPVTTDAVSGVRHQSRTTNDYDADGNVIRTELRDVLTEDPPRVSGYEYDEHNRLARSVDAEGAETSFGYDRFGNRTSMVDANGNHYEYAFTSRNTIAEVRLRDWRGDPEGSPAPATGDYLVLNSYAYDHAGRMVRQTDAMGQRLEYTYYRDDLPEKVILKGFRNPGGSTRDYVIEANTYDGAGNVIRQESANGQLVTQHVVNRAGRVESTTLDPTGVSRRTSYVYDAAGNVTRTTWSGQAANVPWAMPTSGQTVEYRYDAAGNRDRETVVGNGTNLVTSYRHDQRGLVTAVTDPRGNVSGANPADHTSTVRHDELERQVSSTGPAVAAESDGGAPQTVNPTETVGYNAFGEVVAVRDRLGNVSRQAHDRLGRVVSASAPSYTPVGGVAANPTTLTRYDAVGNVTEVVDPRGNATRYGHDQLNRVTVRDAPGSTNDERALWRYTYTRTGEMLSVTDPSGARTETTYDDLDRPVTVTEVERRPVADTFTTRHTYDDAGNLVESVSPGGSVSRLAYNKVGELLRSTTPAGVVTEYGYDLHGRQVRMTDGLGRTSRVDFDVLGRVAAESDLSPAGNTLRTQSYGYDAAGNLTSATDAQQRVTSYAYDARSLLVRQVEPVADGRQLTTSFGYDAAGNRTRYTDGRGNATIYTVNSLGLPATVVEPATAAHPAAADRTWSMSYDLAGNPEHLRSPGDVVRTREYDAAGRLTREAGSGAGQPERRLGYDLTGRLVSAQAPTGTDTFTYNDRGGVLSSAGPAGAASFGYDDDGRVTTRTDPAGTAHYAYRNARLHTLTDAVTGTTQTLGYDAAGAVKTVDYGSGRVRGYGYDDFGRVSSDVLRNSGGAEVASIRYEYDVDDRLTRKTTAGTAGAADNRYGYDWAGRITSWTAGDETTEYAWDDSGNRIRAGGRTASYDARNRLLTDGDHTYAWTARGTLAGRTSSGHTETYSFDAFDRLTEADGQHYTYDSLDRLAQRDGAAFRYAGLGDEVVSDGTETYARGPGGELLAVADGTRERIALADEHGDVVGGFDPADPALPALADSTAYDPFGQRIATAGEESNLGFQGDWTDPATDQVNMGARWYDPATGTFDSRDSVTYGAGESILANRYTYGAGDPLANSDPDGHWPSCGWCKKAVSKVSGAVSSAWRATKSAVSYAASYAYSAARTAWNYTVSAVKYVASKVTSAAKWVYNKARTAVTWVAKKVVSAARWVASKASAAVSWARERAAAMKRAAVAAAHRVTNAAKAAVRYAIKHNPLPAIAAALKPVYSGLKSVVSTVASLPAKVVSTVRNVVHDVAKSVQVVYQKAVEAAGTVVQAVSTAAAAVSEFVQEHAATIAGIAAGAVVGIGCGVAIGWTGVGAVACGALAGAVGSIVHDLVEGGHSWKEMAGNALFGGVIGGLTGGLGSVAGAAIGSGVRALSGGARSALQSAGSAARGEVANIASGRVGGLVGRARGACNSFAPGTAVLMADGSSKPIEQVRVGEKVIATDPTTGRTEAREVTDLISGQGEKSMVEVTVDVDGAAGDRTGTLTATDGHPFWVAGPDRWVTAEKLTVGAMLRTAAGTFVQITGIKRWTAQGQRAHNLTVDGLHTYHVVAGGAPVLVHNDVCRLSSVGKPGDVVVLGNIEDTKVAKTWAGHLVLDDPNWTPAGNMQWIEDVADAGREVYLATPIRFNTLWDSTNVRHRVFRLEIDALVKRGYEFVDDTRMVPGRKP